MYVCYWGWDGRGRRGKLHNVQSTKSKLQLNIPTQSILSSPDSLPCQAVWLAVQTLAQTLVGRAANPHQPCDLVCDILEDPHQQCFQQSCLVDGPWLHCLGGRAVSEEGRLWRASYRLLGGVLPLCSLPCTHCEKRFLLVDTLTLHAFLTTSKLTSQLHE